MTNITILFITVLAIGFMLWRLNKRNMISTYTKSKRNIIIYMSILLLSMCVDELFFKQKREVLVKGNVKESFETVDNIYMGNIKDIKEKYILDEWDFPYMHQKLTIHGPDSSDIIVEYVDNTDSIYATFYYNNIISDYEMNQLKPNIDVKVVDQELFITSQEIETMFRRVFSTSILNNFPEYEMKFGWGGDHSMAILYLQVPKNVMVKTNSDDVWISELNN